MEARQKERKKTSGSNLKEKNEKLVGK